MIISAYAIPGVKTTMPNSKQIEKAVVNHFGETSFTIRKKDRLRNHVICRQAIFYLLRKHTKLTFKAMGGIYGKDHTTAIHSCQTMQDLIDTDIELRESIRLIERSIGLYSVEEFQKAG